MHYCRYAIGYIRMSKLSCRMYHGCYANSGCVIAATLLANIRMPKQFPGVINSKQCYICVKAKLTFTTCQSLYPKHKYLVQA